MSTDMENKDWKKRAKDVWLGYETKIILMLGFILVAFMSFEAGIMKGREYQEKPVIIENSASALIVSSSNNNPSEASNLPQEGQNNADNIDKPPQNCAFVGSKNSNKYHLPTCRWARQIKQENRVCFSTPDEAKSKGYLPDKNCIK
jgi:hypothetical protein